MNSARGLVFAARALLPGETPYALSPELAAHIGAST
jgi:hypothetical protein